MLDVLDDVDDGAGLERWRRREAAGRPTASPHI